jgi:DNA mismatch endonuclease (patch repair protein)
MSSIKAKNTKPELMVRKALWSHGIRGYRLHWKKASGRPDIAFPGKKVAIFIHGCYWHRCPFCKPSLPKTHTEFWENKFKANRERDALKTKALVDSGWTVLILWECQIQRELLHCVSRIKELLKNNFSGQAL